MSDDCGIPGYGVDGHENQSFVMGRMEGVNRGDYPAAAVAIEARTPVKWNAAKTALEPVTASTDEIFGIATCDKAAADTRHNFFTAGDFNRELLNVPAAVDIEVLQASNSRIFFKSPIFSGAE